MGYVRSVSKMASDFSVPSPQTNKWCDIPNMSNRVVVCGAIPPVSQEQEDPEHRFARSDNVLGCASAPVWVEWLVLFRRAFVQDDVAPATVHAESMQVSATAPRCLPLRSCGLALCEVIEETRGFVQHLGNDWDTLLGISIEQRGLRHSLFYQSELPGKLGLRGRISGVTVLVCLFSWGGGLTES